MPKMMDMETGFPVPVDSSEPPNQGKIILDGINISHVPLSRVRQSIAIIPQVCVMFMFFFIVAVC
jgi:ABC-type cobalamin/Fe3+-siderophores transport system ATPase subunit